MENLVAKIKEELNVFVENADAQVEKGNKAAGARARKAALELMKDLKEFRKVSVEESKKQETYDTKKGRQSLKLCLPFLVNNPLIALRNSDKIVCF